MELKTRGKAIRPLRSSIATFARTALAALLLACSSDGGSPIEPDPDPIDLDAVFAPPTAAERAAVEAEWAARAPVAADVRTELTIDVSVPGVSATLRVVSHVVDGNRHYGAILAPDDVAERSSPVLVYLHGGDQGTDVAELLQVLAVANLDPNDFVVVQPSFRSERLLAPGSSWVSEGGASPWDRDVDDAIALLDVALTTTPAADPERIAAVGLSRGGGVALLMGVRDPRIDAVVEFFGPTDFFDGWVREITEDVLGGRTRDLPGLATLTEQYIAPFGSGLVSVAELRHQLLLRSPARFAARLPATQVHHGTADEVVSVSQAERLIQAMEAIDRAPSEFEAFLYPGANHSPFLLNGSADRAAAFLRRLLESAGAGVR